MADVVVVGSLNVDLVVRAPRLPNSGETISAQSLDTVPGGKGANQAVAAARLGVSTAMVGRVGEDDFGQLMRKSLGDAGVDVRGVLPVAGQSTGVAVVIVAPGGQNAILAVPGANGAMGPEAVGEARPLFSSARVILLQLEIPMATVIRAAQLAREAGALVVLDPAPARPLPAHLIRLVDFVTPNEVEAQALTGITVRGRKEAADAAQELLGQGFRRAIVKLGPEGALFAGPEGTAHVPSPPVKVVDTTAAGDAFAGALAAALAQGLDLHEAVQWGCTAGALAVTRPGAQPSLPHREEFLRFLEGR
ncbi:ribokinase [Caldinitratiruptor microaerophilus]|uniref:Ribokinase n=1 Tax=Caldinitratiruptor microaerophilus TaxID=671077 RepID=A0AA35CMJ5_9FIRM|nr:ribokinase [Caldinitratiruptor microaerophilus]BDG60101.1 ribokinase [Caldinitratiruptor microaerophilus]